MIQRIHGRYNHMRIALDKIMDMNKEKSAFPHESGGYSHGMTLRDYFAAKAMEGHFAYAGGPLRSDMETLSHYYYQLADAMLKARDAK